MTQTHSLPVLVDETTKTSLTKTLMDWLDGQFGALPFVIKTAPDPAVSEEVAELVQAIRSFGSNQNLSRILMGSLLVRLHWGAKQVCPECLSVSIAFDTERNQYICAGCGCLFNKPRPIPLYANAIPRSDGGKCRTWKEVLQELDLYASDVSVVERYYLEFIFPCRKRRQQALRAGDEEAAEKWLDEILRLVIFGAKNWSKVRDIVANVKEPMLHDGEWDPTFINLLESAQGMSCTAFGQTLKEGRDHSRQLPPPPEEPQPEDDFFPPEQEYETAFPLAGRVVDKAPPVKLRFTKKPEEIEMEDYLVWATLEYRLGQGKWEEGGTLGLPPRVFNVMRKGLAAQELLV